MRASQKRPGGGAAFFGNRPNGSSLVAPRRRCCFASCLYGLSGGCLSTLHVFRVSCSLTLQHPVTGHVQCVERHSVLLGGSTIDHIPRESTGTGTRSRYMCMYTHTLDPIQVFMPCIAWMPCHALFQHGHYHQPVRGTTTTAKKQKQNHEIHRMCGHQVTRIATQDATHWNRSSCFAS